MATIPNILSIITGIKPQASITFLGGYDGYYGGIASDSIKSRLLTDNDDSHPANTFYWSDYASCYLDFEIPVKINLWAYNSQSYPTYKCDTEIHRWNATSGTWELFATQQSPLADKAWTKIYSNIPAGRYRVKRYNTVNTASSDPYVMHGGWYVETAVSYYLLFKNKLTGQWLTSKNKQLEAVPSLNPTAADFIQYGVNALSTPELISFACDDNLEAFIYADGATATPISKLKDFGSICLQTLTNIDVAKYAGVNSITIEGVGGRYAISFDGGQTWNVKTNDKWNYELVNAIPTMTSNTSPSGEAFSSPVYSSDASYGAWKAFNKLVQAPDYWYSVTAPPADIYLGYDFKAPKIVYKYSITSYAYSANQYDWIDWTFRGFNADTGKWDVLDEQTGHSWTVAQTKEFTIPNSKAYAKYACFISKAYNTPVVSEVAMYCKTLESAGVTQVITLDELYAKGMTINEINALTPEFFSTIFKHTTLSIAGALTADDTLTKVTVTLPPDKPPILTIDSVTPSSTHATDVVITFTANDPEVMTMQHQVLLNGVAATEWHTTVAGSNQITIPYATLVTGSNSIQVNVKDEFDNVSSQTTYVTLTNDPPVKTLSTLKGVLLTATIGDSDNDPIAYRILVNGNLQLDWTEYKPSPCNLSFMVDRADIVFGQPCTVRVEFKDSIGATGSFEETFIGSYYGLLFTDETGDFYSTDMNVVLKRLQMGAWVVGQNSLPQVVRILNTTGVPLSNIRVSVDPTSIPPNTYVKLSHDLPTFDDADIIDITKTINNGDYVTFQVRVSSELSATIGGIFKIKAVGTPA